MNKNKKETKSNQTKLRQTNKPRQRKTKPNQTQNKTQKTKTNKPNQKQNKKTNQNLILLRTFPKGGFIRFT